MNSWRARLSALVVGALMLAVGGTSGAAAATPTGGSLCGPIRASGFTSSILSPVKAQRVLLAEQPALQVVGVSTGAGASDITGVQLFGDGEALGPAKITKSDALRPAEYWKRHRLFGLEITPPPGKHTLTACISTAAGLVAVATTTFTASAPAASATVVDPDVRELAPTELSRITLVDDSGLTFSRSPGLSAGDVVVAGLSPRTPDGLLRRVLSVRTAQGQTRVQTAPASLTDALIQADIHVEQVLSPAAGPAGRSTSSLLHASADLPLVAFSGEQTLFIERGAGSAPGVTGKGSVRLTQKVAFEARGTLEFDLRIRTRWSWTLGVTPYVDHLRFKIAGDQDLSLVQSISGSGNIEKEVVSMKDLPKIPIPGPLPLFLTPSTGLAIGGTAELQGSATTDVVGATTFALGADYREGVWTSLDDFGATGAVSTPEGAVAGSLRGYLALKAELRLQDVVGPTVELDAGVKATATPLSACLVHVDAGPFGRARVGAKAAVFGRTIAEYKATLPEVYYSLYDGDVSRCEPETQGPTISTTSLPDATAGARYSVSLEGNGEGVLTWSAAPAGLPAGLTLSPAGVISGTPTTAGSTTVSVRVQDGAGHQTGGALELRIGAALPPPVEVPSSGGGGGQVVLPAPTGCGGGCAVSWGDPHLTSFDGSAYDLQQVGEFTLVDSTIDDLEIQVRQQPYGGSRLVSGNSAVAASVEGHRVVITQKGDRISTTVDGAATAGDAALPAGGRLDVDGAGRRTITWPDGSFLAVDGRDGVSLATTVGLSAGRAGRVTGLLGDADGSAADDLTGRDGSLHARDALEGFGDSWRITQDASLFDYEPGESTATLTDRGFPYGTISVPDLPAATREAAAGACAAAGVIEEGAVQDCILDVAVSGRAEAAAGAATAQDAAGALVVSGTANVFAVAGVDPRSFPYGTGAGGVAVPVTPGQKIRVSATGAVGCVREAFPAATPDGAANCGFGRTDVQSAGGISGVRHTSATMFLTGVFAGASVSSTTPDRLDFSTSALGTDFTRLSPMLQQTFFIGDGRTGSGQVQEFIAPAGSTTLYLGIVDGYDLTAPPGYYDDNSGAYSVVVDTTP